MPRLPPPRPLALVILLLSVAGFSRADTPASSAASRSALALTGEEARFVASVRDWAARHPIWRRHHTVEALAADPAYNMKYREKPAHQAHIDDSAWQRFALSLADADAANILANALPEVAAAARLARDPALLDYVLSQLGEAATWAPIQRPGWSGGEPVRSAWLGTAWGVRGIVTTLAELPAGSVPPRLEAALRHRLEDEIAGIREDWRAGRAWYVRDDAAYSNQWILPLEALALASLHNGLDRHREDYEFAVAGLLRALDAQGPAGEGVEGMQYANMSFESLLSAAVAARAAGDDRLVSHPALAGFPLWHLHHRQPAGFLVNAFDARNPDLDWSLLARFAVELRDPHARWALDRRPPPAEAPRSLALLRAARLADVPGREPPTFAAYPVAARVNWIESNAAHERGPANRVSGFWMRGGHRSDEHDHQDRGHVNFIVAGRPVLIEAGLASYGITEHPTHYGSVAGHNVLQIGAHAPSGLTPSVLRSAGQILDRAHRGAPLDVRRLDASGGEVAVDVSACYAGLKRWVRVAAWNARELAVRDEVELVEPEVVVFRWHLGAPADASVSRPAPGCVEIDGIRLEHRPHDSVPLEISVESMPDNTLALAPGRHATVVTKTAGPTRVLTLTTRASVAP